MRYDHRLLFDILERIEYKIDTPIKASIFSENQSLIDQPYIKTVINREYELQALEAKLINHDQNHTYEFRSQLESDIFLFE